MSEEFLTEILTESQFDDFKSKNLGILAELKEFDDGWEFQATDKEYYFLPTKFKSWIEEKTDEYSNDLVYGSDKTKNVVSIEVKENQAYIYTETTEGVKLEIRPFKPWLITTVRPASKHILLNGNLPFKYMVEFPNEAEKKVAVGELIAKFGRERYRDFLFNLYDERESFMVRHGMTYFKGMSPNDVSILSFDIETNKTLDPTLKHAKTLLIANTFRKNGQITKKLFALDEYKNELTMILEWCKWVREIDPSVLTGHNIFAFDLYYLQNRLKITQKTQIYNEKVKLSGLPLGRDGSEMTISPSTSQFRKDGSQSYDYHKTKIFGREIIDGFFMSIRHDIGRDFPSYGLKPIIEHLGLEKEGRIKWDFEKDNPAEIFERRSEPDFAKKWEQYKEYCIDDADDSLKLFDIMIHANFYLTTNTPMSFQAIYESAIGAQINKILIRGYLEQNHSIPKPSPKPPFKGAISMGIPGVYKNVFGLDFAALYPSIIQQWQLYDKQKDPLGLFLKCLTIFAQKRNENKYKYQELKKNRENNELMLYFYNLQNSQKTTANSFFGMSGTGGLHFNSEFVASEITRHGRELFEQVLVWATGESEQYWRNQL